MPALGHLQLGTGLKEAAPASALGSARVRAGILAEQSALASSPKDSLRRSDPPESAACK
jgi:hypothetical protein